MRKKVEIPMEIEDIKEDPYILIVNQIKKHGFVSRAMLNHNCGLTAGIINNVIRQLISDGVIKVERKLIKFKGTTKYVSVRGYMFPDKNGK